MKDIESVGFTYNEEKEELRCSVCTTEGGHMDHANKTNNFSATGIFKYESQVTGVSFSPDQCLPEKFRNLKKHVRRHIKQSATRVQNLRSQMEKQKQMENVKTKNYEAGMNIGRTCDKLFLKGRPFTDYEEGILVLKRAKANVGQLNHSRKFPSAFLPNVAKEVERNSLHTSAADWSQAATCALSGDKATYKHKSRQFLGDVTTSPGGENFLETLSFGQPIVKEGSAPRH